MKKIDRILIANRSEIVSRVIRTCKEMDIETVSIFSESDKNSPYVKEADISVFIGNSKPEESYLNQDKIISIALKYNCDAIHPGYGFLSENYQFAEKCKENNLIFIGPDSEIIKLMGDKISARELMIKNDIPVISGYHVDSDSYEEISSKVSKISFPVLIKASAGGGGKGMRIVHEQSQLKEAIDSAKREALHSFGNESVFIEKYFSSAHHIEFQIFGDNHGNQIHLFERECSIQRRYQKIIEETPSPFLNSETRMLMAETSLKIANILNYNNAGTIEFLVDEDNNFYFMEMNTRLQVEHPITESVTGIDLVKLQIEISQGSHLKLKQEDIKVSGHSIEVRLYAEDPVNNFSPSIGQITKCEYPENISNLRIDNSINSNSFIDIHYDPMLAKIIVLSETREKAIGKLKKALKETIVHGISTNKSFLLSILNNKDFISGHYDTSFIEKHFNKLIEDDNKNINFFLIAGFLNNWFNRKSKINKLKDIGSGWRNTFYQYQKEFISYNNKRYEINYRFQDKNIFQVFIDNSEFKVDLLDNNDEKIECQINDIFYSFYRSQDKNKIYLDNSFLGTCFLLSESRFPPINKSYEKGEYKSPLPGEILKINVESGQHVKEGDILLVIISMKMENTIYAHSDGVIEEIFVSEKTFVDSDKLLLKLIP